MTSSRNRRLALSRGPLHVREFGPSDGEPVVFLHGVLANSRLWEGVATRLAGTHRCVLLDLPLGAHPEGMSQDAELSPHGVVALVIEALDALGIERATLVGNDSGGALCQMLIAAHPQRLRSVVLTSSDAYDVWLPLLFKPFELAAFVPGALFIVSQLLSVRVLRELPIALGWLCKRMPLDIGASFVHAFRAHAWARRDVAKFLRGISPKLTTAAAQHFAAFQAPVLLLWSREDRFFHERLARRLAADLPHAELTFVPDAYTFSPLDQPELVASHIGRFLASAR